MHVQVQNDLIIRCLNGEKVERPPIWLMRQAGRILPQYRAIRSSLDGFKTLLKNPDLASTVTIQPVDELNVDAAILFSDILVIPEAMGLNYKLVEKKGPLFDETLTIDNIKRLRFGEDCLDDLHYVFDAIDHTIAKLNGRVPLLGFTGAPWTLFAYMVEGQGSKTFSKAKAFMYKYPAATHEVFDKLTQTIIAYAQRKVKHGVSAIQVFDSWAGMLDRDLYRRFCLPYLQRITQALSQKAPVILYPKGAWFAMEDLAQIPDAIVGIDWTIEPTYARKVFGPSRVLQGNLDPCCLYAAHDHIEQQTRNMISAFGRNHIVNLGHGVYPDTPLDGVKAFVNTVLNYKY